MKIRVLNNSVRLFFNKKDVEKVKNNLKIDHERNQNNKGSGISYGLELVDGDNEGAVFTGTKIKFCLSKSRAIAWFENGGRVWSQIVPVGLNEGFKLTLEKIDEDYNNRFGVQSTRGFTFDV